ncbi:hypothetical protein JW992_07690 [candidate division KSB1 bacterium]|nr:hypothetical protein [candidate division KSB1 bacterium]
MENKKFSEKELKLAEACRACPVCSRARRKQKGLAYWFVKTIESGICPACAAYEKVYGRKAHEQVEPNSEPQQG